MRIIVLDVQTATAVLLVDPLFVAKKRLLGTNYRHDCLRYNDVAIAVNELHVSKKMSIGYKINE
jgi:hypothetical protein